MSNVCSNSFFVDQTHRSLIVSPRGQDLMQGSVWGQVRRNQQHCASPSMRFCLHCHRHTSIFKKPWHVDQKASKDSASTLLVAFLLELRQGL